MPEKRPVCEVDNQSCFCPATFVADPPSDIKFLCGNHARGYAAACVHPLRLKDIPGWRMIKESRECNLANDIGNKAKSIFEIDKPNDAAVAHNVFQHPKVNHLSSQTDEAMVEEA